MKALAPVFVVLALLLAFVSAVTAQQRIHNPELPQHLIFQWQIRTDQVDASWSNSDFSMVRDNDGLVVYFGMYRTLEEALDGLPKLPRGVKKSDVSLIPFFNQRSISSEDALVLLGNLNERDVHPESYEEEAVSFTVYYATFDAPQGRSIMEQVDEVLSFEVLPNYHFAYSAGQFRTLEQAQDYAEILVAEGYDGASVNKFLNGQRVAFFDESQLNAFVAWAGF
jgi:hypothetical protein